MARKKNASFVGSPLGDVARDSSIVSRWIANTVGDMQLLYDRITGENSHSPTDTINHSGNGRGCPMALPLACQQIGRELRIVGGVNQADFYILIVPVYVPTGTGRYILEVEASQHDDDKMFAEVRDTAWAIVDGPVVGTRRRDGERTARFRLSFGPGWQYVAVRRYLWHDDVDATGFLWAWRLWPDWQSDGTSAGLAVPGNSVTGNPFPAMASLTPATVAPRVIDSDMVKDDAPLDAWVLTRTNTMIGTLWEYLTGAPNPGNNTITCSTQRDHSRLGLTAEPLLQMPVASVALSCMKVDNVTIKSDFVGTIGTGAPIEGPIEWVRYPQTATGTIVVSRFWAHMPPFNATAGTSDLDARVIILDYNTGGIGANWQARFVFTDLAATATTSAWVTFANIAGTNLYQATFTGLGCTSSNANEVRLELQNTVGGSIVGQEIVVLGYGLAYTP